MPKQFVVKRFREASEIEPEQVPNIKFLNACVILNSCLKQALANPALRAEFEAWKERRRAEENPQ